MQLWHSMLESRSMFPYLHSLVSLFVKYYPALNSEGPSTLVRLAPTAQSFSYQNTKLVHTYIPFMFNSLIYIYLDTYTALLLGYGPWTCSLNL